VVCRDVEASPGDDLGLSAVDNSLVAVHNHVGCQFHINVVAAACTACRDTSVRHACAHCTPPLLCLCRGQLRGPEATAGRSRLLKVC
jgi:hypothetical protein